MKNQCIKRRGVNKKFPKNYFIVFIINYLKDILALLSFSQRLKTQV